MAKKCVLEEDTIAQIQIDQVKRKKKRMRKQFEPIFMSAEEKLLQLFRGKIIQSASNGKGEMCSFVYYFHI